MYSIHITPIMSFLEGLMTEYLTYVGIGVAASLICFAIYIAFKYRGNEEKFNRHRARNLSAWRILQICGVVMIVVLGFMQIRGWK